MHGILLLKCVIYQVVCETPIVVKCEINQHTCFICKLIAFEFKNETFYVYRIIGVILWLDTGRKRKLKWLGGSQKHNSDYTYKQLQ